MAQTEIDQKKNVLSVGSKELAYLGDSVYEVNIRKTLIRLGIRGVKELNNMSMNYVSALYQADIFSYLKSYFTEDEMNVAKRGRNTKIKHSSKSVNIATYRLATALECVFGYLYLLGNNDRINELIDKVFEYKNIEVL
ncbi:ribonuclease III domain-containing protein [Anaerofustis sp.]|uniref:Mini-ribonuclease 3 n=1 Tax=Anaerofustis sp. TaxID=1872517 RepID=UPI0025C5B8DE|nr:ribonuclease III domain-containing protein [Anaerofustis sp.]